MTDPPFAGLEPGETDEALKRGKHDHPGQGRRML